MYNPRGPRGPPVGFLMAPLSLGLGLGTVALAPSRSTGWRSRPDTRVADGGDTSRPSTSTMCGDVGTAARGEAAAAAPRGEAASSEFGAGAGAAPFGEGGADEEERSMRSGDNAW